MIRSEQLKTPKGSLTNARTVSTDAYEALFSYDTLVGVKLLESTSLVIKGAGLQYFSPGFYIQRAGKAASRTTGKHIGLWLKGWNHSTKDVILVTDEATLQALVR